MYISAEDVCYVDKKKYVSQSVSCRHSPHCILADPLSLPRIPPFSPHSLTRFQDITITAPTSTCPTLTIPQSGEVRPLTKKLMGCIQLHPFLEGEEMLASFVTINPLVAHNLVFDFPIAVAAIYFHRHLHGPPPRHPIRQPLYQPQLFTIKVGAKKSYPISPLFRAISHI